MALSGEEGTVNVISYPERDLCAPAHEYKGGPGDALHHRQTPSQRLSLRKINTDTAHDNLGLRTGGPINPGRLPETWSHPCSSPHGKEEERVQLCTWSYESGAFQHASLETKGLWFCSMSGV